MKKLAIRFILAASLMVIPVSSFAMNTIADNDMDTVTGQAGVSVAVTEAIDMNVKVDSFGFSTGDGGTGLTMALAAPTGDGMNIKVAATTKDLKMEVGTDATDKKTTIALGLPATTITISNIPSVKLGVSTAATATAPASSSSIGTVNVGTTTLKLNTGAIKAKIL